MKKEKNSKYMCSDIEKLRAAFNGIPAFHGGDTRFISQALMFLCERAVVAPLRKQGKPSAWQAFFAKGMRAGKSPAQIAKEWKSRTTIKVA